MPRTPTALRRIAPWAGAGLLLTAVLGGLAVRRASAARPPSLAEVAAMPCDKACVSYRRRLFFSSRNAPTEANSTEFQQALRIWQATPPACGCPRPELHVLQVD